MALIQSLSDLESFLAIKEISIYGVLVVVIIYFWYENKQLKDRINKVIDNHKDDLKESNKDFQVYLEKWNALTNEIKDILRSK